MDGSQPPPSHSPDDDLVLRAWEGDEEVKGAIILRFVPALERAIGHRFGRLHSGEVEDVVAEAIRRFWVARMKFDPHRVRLGACLYRLSKQVACEYTSGRLKWQKARLLEESNHDAFFETHSGPDAADLELDRIETSNSPLLKALGEEFHRLDPMERDIWQTFADADGYEVDASQLGIEMGEKYKGGVAIPGGTIRVIKHRAKDKLVRGMAARGFDLKKMGYIQ